MSWKYRTVVGGCVARSGKTTPLSPVRTNDHRQGCDHPPQKQDWLPSAERNDMAPSYQAHFHLPPKD